MKVVWKFPVPVGNVSVIRMPRGANVLCVGAQQMNLCVWALVDPKADTEEVTLRVLGTGHEFDDEHDVIGRYLGTAHMLDGRLVWHVFQISP